MVYPLSYNTDESLIVTVLAPFYHVEQAGVVVCIEKNK